MCQDIVQWDIHCCETATRISYIQEFFLDYVRNYRLSKIINAFFESTFKLYSL